MSTSILQFVTGTALMKPSTGSIQLFKECSLDAFDDHSLLDLARLEADKSHLQFSDKSLVCIVSVPSFMIPHDLLQFLAPVTPDIHSITTLRHYSAHDRYFALLQMVSPEAAARFIGEYHGTPLCTLQPTTCLVYR